VWLNFGGKRENGDKTPIETACREFHEETGGIFEENSVIRESFKVIIGNPLPNKKSNKVDMAWFNDGQYLLFFIEIPWDSQIPDIFAQKREIIKSTKNFDQVEIKWIPFSEFSHIVKMGYCKDTPLYSFFRKIMNGNGVLENLESKIK
jgi:8-oxo-dGTP pyrophosphatase MutT (NUDIX family)